MRTTISTKGQIILPAEIRREDDIRSGQQFQIERIDRGEYLLKRMDRAPNDGLVNLLLSCPVKDWFQSLNRYETTDDIKLPTFEWPILSMQNVISDGMIAATALEHDLTVVTRNNRDFRKTGVRTLNPFE